MRNLILILAGLLQTGSFACTFAKITRNGYTMVGNNEDAWSINARIRFENGAPGEFGAVYVGHYNGSPLRAMLDQGGMNEAGLMFDGLGVPYKAMPRRTDRPWGDFASIVEQVMRTCSTVHEAAAVFSKYDMSQIAHAMIVLVDRRGDYLVVEGDTLFTGNDASYALANFRPSTCKDQGTVEIPRFQKGRAVIAQGADTSLAFSTAVMDSMRACRTKLGNGTLYTNILDPQRGLIHLYFYHDFSEVRTFNVKEELAKGDHSMEMATLFGKRPEYEALVGYITPIHQRWLFWGLLALALLACLSSLSSMINVVRSIIARSRKKAAAPLLPLLHIGLVNAFIILLVIVLLANEGVFYFGLGDVHPALAWLPMGLLLLAIPLFRSAVNGRDDRARAGSRVVFGRMTALSVLVLSGLTLYWGTLVPW